MSGWFHIVGPDAGISQGDILHRCPIFKPTSDTDFHNLPDPASIELEVLEMDVIVLTQSCVIQKARPELPIILCPLMGIEKFEKKNLDSLRKDQTNQYHLLAINDTDGTIKYVVVDFTIIFSIPYRILLNWVSQKGSRPRLSSPHLELLSQRFGLTFSRIGYDDKQKIDEHILISAWQASR